MEKTTAYVILARYADQTGAKVIAVYDDQDAAQDALELIQAGEPVLHPVIVEAPMYSA